MKTPFTYRHSLTLFGSVFLHNFENFLLGRCNTCHDAGVGDTFGFCDRAYIYLANMVEPQSSELHRRERCRNHLDQLGGFLYLFFTLRFVKQHFFGRSNAASAVPDGVKFRYVPVKVGIGIVSFLVVGTDQTSRIEILPQKKSLRW